MILHFANNNSFIGAYIEFIRNNFDIKNHLFLINGNREGLQEDETINLFLAPSIGKFRKFRKEIKPYFEVADKVILHGLFIPNIVFFLFFNRKFLKKCYWVIYGGDLYYYKYNSNRLWSKFYEIFRKKVIKNMQGLITHLNGDYLYAKKTYNVKGNYFYCLIYLSNVFGNYNFEKRVNKEIKIQVGNSADFSNNHLEIFEKLRNVKDNNIKIVCPLSYGENNKYTKKVIEKGKHIFGKKFIPILEYLPFKEYLKLLSEIDIAIFNHDRQQAMGNIITLIGLGKKVYLRDDISTWNSLNEINLKVFSFNNSDFSLELLRKEEIIENNLIINRNYSESKLIEQWQKIFNN